MIHRAGNRIGEARGLTSDEIALIFSGNGLRLLAAKGVGKS